MSGETWVKKGMKVVPRRFRPTQDDVQEVEDWHFTASDHPYIPNTDKCIVRLKNGKKMEDSELEEYKPGSEVVILIQTRKGFVSVYGPFDERKEAREYLKERGYKRLNTGRYRKGKMLAHIGALHSPRKKRGRFARLAEALLSRPSMRRFG